VGGNDNTTKKGLPSGRGRETRDYKLKPRKRDLDELAKKNRSRGVSLFQLMGQRKLVPLDRRKRKVKRSEEKERTYIYTNLEESQPRDCQPTHWNQMERMRKINQLKNGDPSSTKVTSIVEN